MLNSPLNRTILLSSFPNLDKDPNWEIKSPPDNNYNCIAFAALKTDRNVWPSVMGKLDGVEWPKDLPVDTKLKTFIKYYNRFGYQLCVGSDFEDGYQKVAIYLKGGECTHAARQQLNGMWVSKLGVHWDIWHSTPEAVAGVEYGNVAQIMKRSHK